MLKEYDPNTVIFEEAVFVNNKRVFMQLASIFGSMMGVVSALDIDVSIVTPVSWMNAINNPTRNTKEMQLEVRRDHPGKSKTWYNNELRSRRKQRTKDWVANRYNIFLDDDDVADSFGIAHYGLNHG